MATSAKWPSFLLGKLSGRAGSVFVAAFLVVIIYCFIPLRTVLRLGGDEGTELMKALLLSKDGAHFADIWNDQPPALTALLSLVIKVFGPSIGAARMLEAVFGVLFFAAFFYAVRQRAGVPVAFIALFFLLAAPFTLFYSASVMLETPTFACALVSLCFLHPGIVGQSKPWVLASGAAMGIALSFKLTALLIVPAAAAELVFGAREKGGSIKHPALLLSLWTVAGLATFLGVCAPFGMGWIRLLYNGNVAVTAARQLHQPDDFPFPFEMLLAHIEAWGFSLGAVAWVFLKGDWRRFSLPIVFLATLAAVHFAHRPWWPYYYLHFALPLAGLAAAGVWHVRIWLRSVLGAPWPMATKFSAALVLYLLMAKVAWASANRLLTAISEMRRGQRIEENAFIAKLRQNAARTRWIYTEDPLCGFAAGLMTPPGLAVITYKRMWSNQLTAEEIIAECKTRKVEQLLFESPDPLDNWSDLLMNSYRFVYGDHDERIYIRKDLL